MNSNTIPSFPAESSTDHDAWHTKAAELLTGGALDTLVALMRSGPLWDGDVPSKTGRDELLNLGLASKCVVSGKAMPKACRPYATQIGLVSDDSSHDGFTDGYQAATYRGLQVYRKLLESGRVKR